MFLTAKKQLHVNVVVFFFFFIFFSVAFSDPRATESGNLCGGANRSSANPNFILSFIQEMQSLSNDITTRRFATHAANSTSGNKTTTIYALAQCHMDLSNNDCLLCFAFARTRLPRCLPSTAARIFLDGCFLRYDDYRFYNESVSATSDTYLCSNDTVSSLRYSDRVKRALGNAASIAVQSAGFGVAKESEAHALAQCWESVGKEGCRVCLEKAVSEVKRCVPSREGRGTNVGCYIRYSNHKFYNDGKSHGLYSRGVKVATALATSALAMIVFFASYVVFCKLLKRKQGRRKEGLIFNKSNTRFKYEVLEKATDYFDQKRILGQGGNGTVFLGVFPNGDTVAVKRLVFNTRQWVDEFFNEVNLLSGIQHKNLVKLLGCSIEGPESLLVYELIPNKSLDHFLFVSEGRRMKVLNWRERQNIIGGTAEGLAYLHGDSPVRIIHRDIKSSNVLLDDQFNPKIADFGLARCFGHGETHLSTGIAGTLGYMAPEYVVRGELTEKADVYSFGVLVLEIACGVRNSVFVPGHGSLVQRVWRLYTQNRVDEALDPCLKEELLQTQENQTEASNMVRVGLLCAQASPSLRPSMEEVVRMLTEKDYQIPAPTNPPFLRISSLTEPESSTRSCSSYSTMSTTAVKTEVASYTSSEPSRTPES